MRPTRERRDASPRRRVRAVALALLLGWCSAAAAERFAIGGTRAAPGIMQLLANEFRARNPDVLVTTVHSLGSRRTTRAAAVERIIAFVQSAPGRKILVSNGHWIP